MIATPARSDAQRKAVLDLVATTRLTLGASPRSELALSAGSTAAACGVSKNWRAICAKEPGAWGWG